MFQNVFQEGKFVEVFSTVDRSLLALWKTTSGVTKVFDASARTFVYLCTTSHNLQIPGDKNKKLGLRQPFLVFQILAPVNDNILIEIGITFNSNRRTRISLSRNRRVMVVNPLWGAVPLVLNTNVWTHLCVNVKRLSQSLWQNEVLKTIDSLSLSGVVRLKRIFTLNEGIIVNREGTFYILYENLPKKLQLPSFLNQDLKMIPNLND